MAQARKTDIWTKIPDRGLQIGLGLLLGLALITKTTAYIILPVILGAVLWQWLSKTPDRGTKIPDRGAPPARASSRRIVLDVAAIGLPAILIALPWYARNIAVYGWPDALGLLRHDTVVVGQLRTEEFLAQNGAAEYVERLSEFTFKSFWGVFGWLGVFMDSRIYYALTLLTLLVIAGLILRWLVWPVWGSSSSGLRSAGQMAAKRATYAPAAADPAPAGRIIAAPVLLTVLAYGWYNVQFVQHQGRYLFTALIPIAIGFSLGWDEAVTPRSARILAGGSLILGGIVAAAALAQGEGLPKWPLALTAAAAVGLALTALLSDRLRPVSFALPFVFLPIIAVYAVWGPITR